MSNDGIPIKPLDMDQSPTTMAASAMAAALANRDYPSKNVCDNDEPFPNDDDDDEVLSSKLLFNEESSDEKSIEKIWKSNDTESNLAETLRLLVTEIDLMVKAGLGAFNELDAANRQLLQSKELIETRSREATRINAMEDQSRASLSVRFITKFYCQKYNFLRQ